MPEARVSLLADVGAVMAPGEDDVWSEVIYIRWGYKVVQALKGGSR
jgi:hypothetical protein